jgi:hypothetical protein
LPFIEEVEIGQRRADDGHWTSEGANGRVYAFRIHPEYNRLPVSPHPLLLLAIIDEFRMLIRGLNLPESASRQRNR